MEKQLELFPELSRTVLDKAQDIVYGDREKTYGDPDKNLRAIAKMWTAYLESRLNLRHLPVSLSSADVCWMMALLKASRASNDLSYEDNVVDAVGYLANIERCK